MKMKRFPSVALAIAASTACAVPAGGRVAGGDLADRVLIRELLDRHQLYIDLRDPARYAGLFSPEAHYESFFASARGREEIEAMARSLHESGFTANKRHLSGPAMIEVDGDRAEVLSYWWVLDTEGTPTVFANGTYHDVLEKVDGEWVIASRELRSDQTPEEEGNEADDLPQRPAGPR